MKLEDFQSGTETISPTGYKSFIPERINCEWTWLDPEINVLLGQANRALGELNAYSQIVPNVELFIQMHVIREATSSSRIEGTKTELNEAILDIDTIDPEKKDDWEEVQNYIAAMNRAIEELKQIPLSLRII